MLGLRDASFSFQVSITPSWNTGPSGSDPFVGRGGGPQAFLWQSDGYERGDGTPSLPLAQLWTQLLQMEQAMLVALLADLLVQMIAAGVARGGGGGGGGEGSGCQSHGGFPGGGWGGSRRLGGGAWGAGGRGQEVGALPGAPTGRGTSGDFLQQALSQNGKPYVYGAEASANNDNPRALDCSELVEWAAARSGAHMPDGSANQLAHCRRHGTEISVDQALRTPGALLFRPGHVAISLGDGRTIEAKGRAYGVGVFNARGRFTAAALVPGMQYGGGPGAGSPLGGPRGVEARPAGSSATARQLDRQLGGRFAGQGQAFVDAARRHGVDPALLAAIAMHETGNGTSRAVRELNNPGGIMDPRTNWSRIKRFDSLEQGLDAMARNLRRNYLNEGRTTISAIGPKYAPVGAANDPRGLNGGWVAGVSRFYNQLVGN